MHFGITTTTGIYPPESGGPAYFTQAFCDWQSSVGMSPKVITLTDQDSKVEYEGSIEIIRVTRKQPLLLRFFKTAILIRKKLRMGTNLLVAGCFLEAYIATIGLKSTYVAKVPGDIVWERARNSGKTKTNIQDFQHERINLKFSLLRFFYTKSLRRAKCVITPSGELRDLCVKWGVELQKIKVVLNSVSLTDFYPQENVNKKYDVLSVGRLVPWKGNSELVRACHELNLSLAIAGSGNDYSELLQLTKKLGAKVTFLGDLTKGQLLDLYNASKYFVLNSMYEGTSHALLEARACGTFAIARKNVGSNSEVISDNIDGLLFETEELPTLLDALKYATQEFKNPTEFSEVIRNDTALRFSQESTFPKIADLVLGSTE